MVVEGLEGLGATLRVVAVADGPVAATDSAVLPLIVPPVEVIVYPFLLMERPDSMVSVLPEGTVIFRYRVIASLLPVKADQSWSKSNLPSPALPGDVVI
jgi:hypothetical protein